MKRLALLTSGGDAPGMNAAIRAVVRSAIKEECQVFGFRQGYAGLIFPTFGNAGRRRDYPARRNGAGQCPEFRTEAGVVQAVRTLNENEIEGLIVIGGNGSQAGAHVLSQKGFPVVGVASTIDNDLYGSEITIGFDTAVNIALEAIDRLKITASSHERAFLIEVMGRNTGYLALMAGIAGGAELVIVPEQETKPRRLLPHCGALISEKKCTQSSSWQRALIIPQIL